MSATDDNTFDDDDTGELVVDWAIEHLTFLAQAQEHQIGPDFSDAVAGVAAGIATGSQDRPADQDDTDDAGDDES